MHEIDGHGENLNFCLFNVKFPKQQSTNNQFKLN